MEETKHKIDFDEKGNIIYKDKKKIEIGGKSKLKGSQFELRVRNDLENKGWIVDKWTNNIDLDEKKIISAKRRMGFAKKNLRIMTIGTGFPDFIAFQPIENSSYKIIGVEVKTNGKLSKIEKEKCKFYLEKKTFSQIWIAKKQKEKKRIKIIYEEFKI